MDLQGDVKLMAESDEDEAGATWTQGVAREWQAELADEREDLYTLDDGEPVDKAASLAVPLRVGLRCDATGLHYWR